MKMRKGLAFAAVLALLAGCGGGSSGLETGAGTVQKKTAEAFLTTVENKWHSDFDIMPKKNVSKDFHCYFTVEKKDTKSKGTAACGPVRRLGSPEGHVWDIIAIEATNGDKA